MREFYMTFARKPIFSGFFLGGGGQMPLLTPVSYAYGSLRAGGAVDFADVVVVDAAAAAGGAIILS